MYYFVILFMYFLLWQDFLTNNKTFWHIKDIFTFDRQIKMMMAAGHAFVIVNLQGYFKWTVINISHIFGSVSRLKFVTRNTVVSKRLVAFQTKTEEKKRMLSSWSWLERWQMKKSWIVCLQYPFVFSPFCFIRYNILSRWKARGSNLDLGSSLNGSYTHW